MKSFLFMLAFIIIWGSIILLMLESKALYNELLAYNFFKQIKGKKFRRAFNITRLIFGKRVKAYLVMELVKALLAKNRVEQAYYIYNKSRNVIVKMGVLELIIDNCIKNDDEVKLEGFLKIVECYDGKIFLESYKKAIIYYENKNRLEKLIELEFLNLDSLNFYIALAYIKLEAFDDVQRIFLKIENPKKIGFLIYEAFKYYKGMKRLDKFNLFYEELQLDEKTEIVISEFLIKIYIEIGEYDIAEKKIAVLNFRRRFDYYILIAKELMGSTRQEYYIERAYKLVPHFPFVSEKIIALIKLTYLTLKQEHYKEKNEFLDEAYTLYLSSGNNTIDMTKEFILLFREYKKYEIFMELLEKKAEIYKEVLNLEDMNEIKPEFVKSINVFLWGDELKVFEDFMKSYNAVQLKDGHLEYDEFYELIHQIKRYVNKDIYDRIDKISLNLSNKPNTLFFINQYLKLLKNP